MNDKPSSPTQDKYTEETTSPLSSSPSQGNPPPSMDASSFLSPQVKSITNNQIERLNSTGQSETAQTDALLEPSDTPLLNGENILLLSFSNDNTPVAANQGRPTKEQNPVLQHASVQGEQNRAESPPADSVHSGQVTTLSPPPLSQKSSGSAHTATGRAQTGMFSSNGSQGMFSSKDVNQNPPTVTSHGNPPSVGGRKKRPPLPPRGAFPGMNYQPGVAAVDVLPSHLPPPKQIGNVSHRRVVSTGDVSHISTLTEGDSVADVMEESPPSTDAAVAVGTAASTTDVPTNPSMFGVETGRQRGVSWDFGAGGRVDEELATFEGLGIMQPVLSEEDLGKLAGDDADLMQPILDEKIQKKSEPISSKQKAASEGMINKVNIGQSGWDKLRVNRKAITQLTGGEKTEVRLSPGAFSKKDGSEFEDEAERAILVALGIHSTSSAPSVDKDVDVESPSNTPLTPDDTVGPEVPSFVSSTTQAPQHRKNVSSMTNLEPTGGSPVPPNIHNLNQKGDLLFEDQGWHDGYDALGRTKGSLREEQDIKITEEVFGSELEVPALGAESSQENVERPPVHPSKKASKAAGLIKPLHIKRAKTEGASKSTPSSKKKKDDDYQGSDEDEDELKPTHMRSKTAVSDMAQEMAKYQTGFHNRKKSNMPKDTHGVNNLLDGADLLFRTDARRIAPKDTKLEPKDAPDDNEEYQENGEADEEMGETRPQRNRAKFVSATRRSSRGGSRSGQKYQLKRWYTELLKPKIPHFVESLKHGILFIYLPILSLAFILYYLCGNPIAGKFDDAGVTVDSASWSWWLLFLVRQAFVLGCVKTGEVITIDIIALRTSVFVNVFGSFATLMLVQARGWPYVMTFWGIMDFIFLYGRHRFAAHWLFWQNFFEIFTTENPGGSFIYSVFYMRILITMIVAGFLTALKRLWIATFLGRRSYLHFNPELEIILSKMLLISSVAHLGRQIEAHIVTDKISDGYIFSSITKSAQAFPGLTTDSEDDSPTRKGRKMFSSVASSTRGEQRGDGLGFGKSLMESGVVKSSERKLEKIKYASSKKIEIMKLLEEWEEPNMHFDSASKTKIKDILQFRQAVALMDDDYCFTPAFGPTSTRAICVDSSEALFNRLVNNDSNVDLLPFETIAEICYDSSGELVKPKAKALIKLFRPDRNGYMAKLDFLNSIDSVYKSIRLFRASLESSSQVDDNLEGIINVVFYTLLVLVSLLVMGFRVWESLLSFTTFFFGFSFMFGPASSSFFEGLLLILLRRPYDVGDKIALSDPSSDTSPSGSSTWFVENITLFTTTVRFATTNEVATYSNGSLARLRIINAKRSPKAVLYVYVKFGSDAPYRKLNIFRSAIESFVKARPREWAQLNGIRTTRVEMELNYVEYVIVVTHREMWQNIGPILSSQADLASFSLEVSKKLELRYHQPPKPVHLSFDSIASEEDRDMKRPSVREDDLDSVADLFKKDE